MALNLTKDDLTLLTDALEQAIASAKRQQNMKGKTATITEVYKKHEQVLQALKLKLAQ